MEIELKLGIPDSETAEQIWTSSYLEGMEEPGSREILEFRGVYFDTENLDLMKNDIAYRVRSEGEKIIATLKWKGSAEDGLHRREEINIPLQDSSQMEKPNPVIFEQTDIGEDLMRIIEGKRLSVVMETVHTRRRLRIDSGGAIMEVSIDEGEIVTQNGNAPISEIEVELFSGEEKPLMKVGEKLKSKFKLTPEQKSKFARGLELLGVI